MQRFSLLKFYLRYKNTCGAAETYDYVKYLLMIWKETSDFDLGL